MNRAMVLFQLDDLKYNLMRMDANYREIRSKATSLAEIADTLKAIRMLRLSIEAGGLDECFKAIENADCDFQD